MGLLELASNNSFWRGYDYFKGSKVKTCVSVEQNRYEGTVDGANNNKYHVMIDLEHPKRSTCECPHAEESRRVCKHKVALFFSAFPEAAEMAIKEAEEWEAEEDKRLEDERKEIEKYVNSLSKQQLREELLWRLIEEREQKNYW